MKGKYHIILLSIDNILLQLIFVNDSQTLFVIYFCISGSFAVQ